VTGVEAALWLLTIGMVASAIAVAWKTRSAALTVAVAIAWMLAAYAAGLVK
jgi:hypothetical protein